MTDSEERGSGGVWGWRNRLDEASRRKHEEREGRRRKGDKSGGKSGRAEIGLGRRRKDSNRRQICPLGVVVGQSERTLDGQSMYH